jgi:beta-apo-4'-carotenal oxygenase
MTSGGATLNDSYFHGSVITVPFGGVGDSGWGAWHGKASFECFSHSRTVAEVPYWMEPFLRIRYMPYDKKLVDLYHKFTNPKPNFDRNGQVIKGIGYWATLLVGLGSQSMKGALLRWLCLLAGVYFASNRGG